MLKLATLIVSTIGMASASTILATGTEPLHGLPIDASATFDFSTAGQLTITLSNLESGISDPGNVLSGLEFSVSGTTTYISSSGTTISCADGSCTPNATIDTDQHWGVGTIGGNVILCIVCPNNVSFSTQPSGTPAFTIIGPNPAPPAKGGINSAPHNPYYNQTLTMVLLNPSFTPQTAPDSLIFSFGTVAGDNVACNDCGGGDTPQAIAPEPFSFLLLGSGLTALGLARRYSMKA